MRTTIASLSAFAAFGVFWGMWGAALPALRSASNLDDAALGTALLFVGLGALPAMFFTGKAADRFGTRIAGPLLVTLAGAGVLIAFFAHNLPTLIIGMTLIGATSGAADVASNALAGLAEQETGRRTITIAHAVFSSFVVIGSLGTGALRTAGSGVGVVFLVMGAVMTVLGVVTLVCGSGPHRSGDATARRRTGAWRYAVPFVIVGLVAALGFAAENAHQSWSAIFLADELDAEPGVTALAPATFATFAALTRFAAGALTRLRAGILLIGGGMTATAGTLLVASATTTTTALAGLALAAIGTSVLFPTLLSEATRTVPAHERGRATSAVATTAYLGFVLGPVFVGFLAEAVGLRGAMMGIALLTAAFAVIAPTILGRIKTLERSA
ncbi:MFS family permease [Arthrobacter sp. CAN_A6]|uniref:MFS transporter n=1 Tax=Arthrobacter sp. CAN_A6 TaxID=2787721 RepID=UPI0018CB89BB